MSTCPEDTNCDSRGCVGDIAASPLTRPNRQDMVSSADLAKAAEAVFVAADRCCEQMSDDLPSQPEALPSVPVCLVAVVGVPGSGKTSFAQLLAEHVARQQSTTTSSSTGIQQRRLRVCSLPMDGYHMYRHELRAMPNSEEAFVRRGAEWTFNATKLHTRLKCLKQKFAADHCWSSAQQNSDDSRTHMEHWFPGFDHAEKDPQEKMYSVQVPSQSSSQAQQVDAVVVIMEGLYLAYTGVPEWAQVASLFDVKIFLHCDLPTSTERLTQRHMRVWGVPRAEAAARAGGSDYQNALLVAKTEANCEVVCASIQRDDFDEEE